MSTEITETKIWGILFPNEGTTIIEASKTSIIRKNPSWFEILLNFV